MNTYVWRKNFVANFSNQEKVVRGKLAFKTKDIQWLETEEPVIVLVSVHSAFHQEIEGDLKMNALLSIIKSHVKGQITVLLSDRAHLQTLSLHYQNNLKKTFDVCLSAAQVLQDRYQPYFENCKVVYWHSYIYQDENFSSSLNLLKNLYETDPIFQELLKQDAETTYTIKRMQTFSDKALFIEKAIEDLLEQCASLLVLSHKGYRFQFYPGSSYAATEYINRLFMFDSKQIKWIDVFLTIEKKTILDPNFDQEKLVVHL